MKLSILDYIVCPTCHSNFKINIKSKMKTEIKEGTLICIKSNHKFKISKGIPRFVVDTTKDFVRTEMAFSEKSIRFFLYVLPSSDTQKGREPKQAERTTVFSSQEYDTSLFIREDGEPGRG